MNHTLLTVGVLLAAVPLTSVVATPTVAEVLSSAHSVYSAIDIEEQPCECEGETPQVTLNAGYQLEGQSLMGHNGECSPADVDTSVVPPVITGGCEPLEDEFCSFFATFFVRDLSCSDYRYPFDYSPEPDCGDTVYQRLEMPSECGEGADTQVGFVTFICRDCAPSE